MTYTLAHTALLLISSSLKMAGVQAKSFVLKAAWPSIATSPSLIAFFMLLQPGHLHKSGVSGNALLINCSASSANQNCTRRPKAELARLHLPVFIKKFQNVGFWWYIPNRSSSEWEIWKNIIYTQVLSWWLWIVSVISPFNVRSICSIFLYLFHLW